MAKKKAARSSAKASAKKASSKKAPAKKPMKALKPAAKKSKSKPAAKTGSPSGEATRALDMLNWTHQMTRKLCSGFPDGTLTFQPSPTDNHLLWQIGHLATGYSWFASMLDGAAHSLGESFDKLFGYQSKPVADAAAYPSLADVQRVHDEQYTRFTAAAGKLKDADTATPTITDSGGLVKSKVDAVVKMAWHEGWHQGQISSLRRALSLPSAMGS